ncbi:hypothetical protein V495_06711 [Pseudogymnoascus sp. VKM F-4514 (FW-929)]|nr:hypothetical protein V495_06711 [Pseudogymnoascus sp. VKM F-4514 (FW-929)]KFY62227.1 hypothetical protein V497_02500 [Pseudogymnoascus sp. VKM F-4516 (FW-969)]
MTTKLHHPELDVAGLLDTDSNPTEPAIKTVLAKKKLQKSRKKSQPWKQTYIVAPDDLPKAANLHDKPYWYGADDPDFPEAGDTSYGA